MGNSGLSIGPLLKLNRNRPRPRFVGFLFIFLGEVKEK